MSLRSQLLKWPAGIVIIEPFWLTAVPKVSRVTFRSSVFFLFFKLVGICRYLAGCFSIRLTPLSDSRAQCQSGRGREREKEEGGKKTGLVNISWR